MAALTEIAENGRWSVGGGVSEPHARRATENWPTGPDLLVWAAAVLPVVVGCGPVRCVDVHTALYESACVRGMGRDRPHRLRLADEALDLLAAYLAVSGQVPAGGRSGDTVRGWLVRPEQRTYPSMGEAQLALAAAGGYWQRELAAALAESAEPNASVGRS